MLLFKIIASPRCSHNCRYSLLDRKISSILNRSEDTSLMVHVQTIVHNAAMYNEDELVMRQLTFLQGRSSPDGFTFADFCL